jgi:hypothetical protein
MKNVLMRVYFFFWEFYEVDASEIDSIVVFAPEGIGRHPGYGSRSKNGRADPLPSS